MLTRIDSEPHSESQHADELAIFVHGTFAGDDDDSGEKWWQAGSQPAEELQHRLPDNVRVAEGEEVFHWSGDNGERARSKAATALLEHLKPLEQSNRPYHLVGHSHGGSVIWNALRMATLAGKPLHGLRSWTTVGTPFIHHSSRSPWHIVNLLGVVLGLLLMRPAFRVANGLVSLIWGAVCGREVEIIARSDAELGYTAVLRAPFLAFFQWLGGSVEATAEGIRLGSYDPAGNVSLLEYIFATREGLLLLAITLFCIYLFLHISIMCIRPVIESLRIRADSRLQRRAFKLYGPRWLGLWTPDDEAINGLRATLDISLSFVKKIVPNERVFVTDNLSLLSRPYYWLLAPIFNRILRPVLDSLVSNVVVRSAQGNDKPSAQVVAVVPTPVLNVQTIPSLPEHLSEKILRKADLHAGDVAPKLRKLLSCPSFLAGLESFSSQLSGKELVHTSYFDHGEVLDLISLNVASGNGKNLPLRGEMSNGDSLTAWFQDFKTQVGGEGPQSLAGQEDIRPHHQPTLSQRRKAS